MKTTKVTLHYLSKAIVMPFHAKINENYQMYFALSFQGYSLAILRQKTMKTTKVISYYFSKAIVLPFHAKINQNYPIYFALFFQGYSHAISSQNQ